MIDKVKFIGFISILFLVFPFICFAQKENKVDKEESLTLKIKLKAPYNSDFSLCTAIAREKPIEFSWIKDGIKSVIRTSVSAPENGFYRLEFEFKEGTEESIHYRSRKEYSLKLGKPEEETDIASSLSNDIYDWKITLSKKACK